MIYKFSTCTSSMSHGSMKNKSERQKKNTVLGKNREKKGGISRCIPKGNKHKSQRRNTMQNKTPKGGKGIEGKGKKKEDILFV